jgi:hypothetical protein
MVTVFDMAPPYRKAELPVVMENHNIWVDVRPGDAPWDTSKPVIGRRLAHIGTHLVCTPENVRAVLGKLPGMSPGVRVDVCIVMHNPVQRIPLTNRPRSCPDSIMPQLYVLRDEPSSPVVNDLVYGDGAELALALTEFMDRGILSSSLVVIVRNCAE